MGLITTGPYSIKKLWPQLWPDCFTVVNQLGDVRDICQAKREETLIILDGNVLMQQVPQSLTDYEDYVRLLVQQIQFAINTAMTVAVVFDEPENLTKAKVREQKSRDERRVASSDLTVCPQDDSYLLSDICIEDVDCHDLVLNRKTRSRFFDGMSTTTLTFDGIDARGWDRPFGTDRKPGILTSDESGRMKKILDRKAPIGEGDLKLCDVPHRIHMSKTNGDWPDCPILLTLLQTVDTDSFLIELLQQAIRAQKPDEIHEKTVLCLKEPPRKETKNHPARGKCFTCCDIENLYDHVVEFMFDGMEDPSTLRREIQGIERIAVLTFALATLMVHTDFVEVPGTRLDHMMEAAKSVFQEDPDTARLTVNVLSGNTQSTLQATPAAQAILDTFLEAIFNQPKLSKSHQKASASASMDDRMMKQAVWNLAYWSHREFINVGFWGFAVDTPTDQP